MGKRYIRRKKKSQGGTRMVELGYSVVHVWLSADELHQLDIVRGTSPRATTLKALAMDRLLDDKAGPVKVGGRMILTSRRR